MGLIGEFGEREHDDVGRAEHGERCDRAGEHADLEAQVLGDARGDRIEYRSRVHAFVTGQHGAQAAAALGPTRHESLLRM